MTRSRRILRFAIDTPQMYRSILLESRTIRRDRRAPGADARAPEDRARRETPSGRCRHMVPYILLVHLVTNEYGGLAPVAICRGAVGPPARRMASFRRSIL